MKDQRHDLLDQMQFRADPLADETMAKIMGDWSDLSAPGEPVGGVFSQGAEWRNQWKKIAAVTKIFGDWTTNENLGAWQPQAGLAPEITAPLLQYVAASRELPEWANRAKMARAEELFMDYGALSVTLLFCASLPECYVIPDLSAVLHVTGQLEKHTDYRVRSTGAMIFPVMMHGGLTDAAGGGMAQIFKVRLIHATIRNLILRDSPEHAVADLAGNAAGVVPPLAAVSDATNMHQVLFAHGWKTGEDGLPCNQEELAYTLLTFSYVFLRGLRTLGLGFTRSDEEAYLHTWNVTGHMLGIDRVLMADTMEGAEKLFAQMQSRGRADQQTHASDPRPALGNALINAMKSVIPFAIFKPFPQLMTCHLVGPETSKDLGLMASVPWLSQILFYAMLAISRVIDTVARLVWPEFSITRFFMRILGYHLITKLMMDQTRPLKLPQHLLNRVSDMVESWSDDKKAPAWLNSVEDRITTQGGWSSSRAT
jgi:ER-bound oxygenase mpaB/B'/Rubber oxygenase, catalytic domain